MPTPGTGPDGPSHTQQIRQRDLNHGPVIGCIGPRVRARELGKLLLQEGLEALVRAEGVPAWVLPYVTNRC